MSIHCLWTLAILAIGQPRDSSANALDEAGRADAFRSSLHKRMEAALNVELRRAKSLIESKRYGEAAALLRELQSPGPASDFQHDRVEIGSVIRLSEQNAEVFQVIPPNRTIAIVHEVSVMLEGILIDGLTDKTRFPRSEYAYIYGTTTYEAATGGTRTCLLARAGSADSFKDIVRESEAIFSEKRNTAARQLSAELEKKVAAGLELELHRTDKGFDLSIRNLLGIQIESVAISIDSKDGTGGHQEIVIDALRAKRSVVRSFSWAHENSHPIASVIRAQPSPVVCTSCNGTRKAPCKACNESGKIRVKKGESATCNKCKGQGKIACKSCES